MKKKIFILMFDAQEQKILTLADKKLPSVLAEVGEHQNLAKTSFNLANNLLSELGMECVAMTPLLLLSDLEVWQPILWAVKKDEETPEFDLVNTEAVDLEELPQQGWISKIHTKTFEKKIPKFY